MSNDQLPVIDGRQTMVRRESPYIDSYSDIPSRGWYIADAAHDKHWYLTNDGRWRDYPTCDDCFWPTEVAAIAFLRSLTTPPAPAAVGKERLTIEDAPGIYTCEERSYGVERFFEWDGITLADSYGKLAPPMELYTNFRHSITTPPAPEDVGNVDELVAALKAADKWFDGWCPNATCCASPGLRVHLQIREALINFRGPLRVTF